MSNADKHPGKGFTPVGGYTPPAGTQAEAIRRQEEADARQRARDAHDRTAQALRDASTNSSKPAGNTVKKSEGCLLFIVAGIAIGMASVRVAWMMA